MGDHEAICLKLNNGYYVRGGFLWQRLLCIKTRSMGRQSPDDIIKSSNNLNAQLGTLKNTLQGVDSSTCNLQDTVDSISSSSKSEKDKVEDLKRLNSRLTEFIEMTTRRDASAKSEIERAKKDFYTSTHT